MNETLKSDIAAVVKTNGNNEITGAIMQAALFSMINELGKYGRFAGIATPTTIIDTENNVFYLCTEPGTYGGTLSIEPGFIGFISNISGELDSYPLLNTYDITGGTSKTIADIYNMFFVEGNINRTGLGTSVYNPAYTAIDFRPIDLVGKVIKSIELTYKAVGINQSQVVFFKKNTDNIYEVVDKYPIVVNNTGTVKIEINRSYDYPIYMGFNGILNGATPTASVVANNLVLWNPNINVEVGTDVDISTGERFNLGFDYIIKYNDSLVDFGEIKEAKDIAQESLVLSKGIFADINSPYTVSEDVVNVFDWYNLDTNIMTFTNYLMTKEQTALTSGFVSKIRVRSEQYTLSALRVAIVEDVDGVLTTVSEIFPTNYESTYNAELRYHEITGLNIPINKGQNLAIYITGVSYYGPQSALPTNGAYWNGREWLTTPSNRGVLMDYYISAWTGIKSLIDIMNEKLDLIPIPQEVRTELKYKKAVSYSFNPITNWNSRDWTLTENTATTTSATTLICNRPYRSDKRQIRTTINFTNDCIILIGGCINENAAESSFVVDVVNKKLQIQQRGVFYDTTKVRKEINIPFNLVADRDYIVDISRDWKTNTIKLSDYVTGQSIELSDDYSETTYLSGSGNIRPLFFVRKQTGTSVTVKGGVEIYLPDNPFMVIGGDSNTESNGRVPGLTWAETVLLNTYSGDGTIVAQSGISITDMLTTMQLEVIPMKPEYFICMIGTNGAPTQAQYNQIISLCNDAGITLILSHIPASNRDFITPNTYIENTGVPTVRQDLATSKNNNPADGVNSALFNTDSIHPNQAGHDAMARRFLVDTIKLVR